MTYLVQNAQIVPLYITGTQDLNTTQTSDRVNMENHNHCTIVINTALVAAVLTYSITIFDAATAGNSALLDTVTQYWRKSGSDLSAVGTFTRVTAATPGECISIISEAHTIVVEVDTQDIQQQMLNESLTGYNYLGFTVNDPAAAASSGGNFILSESRYAQDIIASALA